MTPETLRMAGSFCLNISNMVNNSAAKKATLKRKTKHIRTATNYTFSLCIFLLIILSIKSTDHFVYKMSANTLKILVLSH